MGEKLTPQQEAERATWQYKVIAATRGNQTQLGAMLIAMMGRSPDHGNPRFGVSAIITSDGYVMARYQSKAGSIHEGALVCHVKGMIDNLRGLSDHLKLDAKDREELFAMARKWIERDYRTTPPPLSYDGRH